MTQRQLESSIGKNIPMTSPWIIDVLVCKTNGWMPAIEIYPIEEKNVKCRWIGYVRVLILPQALEASSINRVGRANRRPWSTIIQRSISVTISYSSFNFESVGNRSIKPSSSWKISAPMFPHLSPFFIYYTPSISLPIDTILLQKTVIPSRCLFF